jgi:hypothetical protein
MAFNVYDFLSNIENANEVAKADKFDVVFALPQQLTGPYGPVELALTCEASELPGIDITPIEYRHHAFIKRIPHHISYSPVTFTFYCTGQMLEKQFFDMWTDFCIPKATGLVNYRLDNLGNPQYESSVTVNQYDQVGNRTYFAQLDEAWPISVSALNLNWSDDSIHRVTVTMVYTKWLTAADGAVGASTPVQRGGGLINNFTNALVGVLESSSKLTPGQAQIVKQSARTAQNLLNNITL